LLLRNLLPMKPTSPRLMASY